MALFRSTPPEPKADKPKKMFVNEKNSSPLFPSTRFLMAVLLCMSFVALSVATLNLSQAMVCMVPKNSSSTSTARVQRSIAENSTDDSTEKPCTTKRTVVSDEGDDIEIIPCSQKHALSWSPAQQGFIYAAQNFGSLFMLFTGVHADKMNGKWTIATALSILVVANAAIPAVASTSVWLVFLFRMISGVGDALLTPGSYSLITRWFPPKERPFALGFVTGGRQIGNLLILPVAGMLCEHSASPSGGWPMIFYVSSAICGVILVVWTVSSADKPSKHCCVSKAENSYITRKIEEERLGKRNERGSPPWGKIARCVPLWVAVAALVCHEYPLVVMIQFLPKYFADVLGLSNTVNGVVSALPAAVLFISKTVSSSFSSYLTAKKPPILSKTTSCKMFNFIASLGLSICLAVTPILGAIEHPAPAILVLCLANAFAGLHTPGVITALVQIAPAYSGIVTGISFTVVAAFSIFNKLLSSFILSTSSRREWLIVFEISAVVAFLPVIFFTIWGSADVQEWAKPPSKRDDDQNSEGSTESAETTVTTIAKSSLFLDFEPSLGDPMAIEVVMPHIEDRRSSL